jgi:hypothetical protein
MISSHDAAYREALTHAHYVYDDMPQDWLKKNLLVIRELIRSRGTTHKFVAQAEVIYSLLDEKI